MLIVVRNGLVLSPKTKFVIQFFCQNSSNRTFFVFKNEKKKFEETWNCGQVQLPSSFIGLITFYLLMTIKSPKILRDGLMARLSLKKRKHFFTGEGFLSTLSRTLYLHFGTSVRTSRLMMFLNRLEPPNIFLIDEFTSLHCLDLKRLLPIGSIIYVSQDIAYNRFAYGDNLVTRKLMYKLERDALPYFDLVVACSEMEKLKYIEMGARKAISYPNIYPTGEFRLPEKDELPSISLILREHWGPTARQSMETILFSLGYLSRRIKVYIIGMKPDKVPKNVALEHIEFLQSKSDYLQVLAKSWLGINVGIHKAGTNERKYDYAEAGTVVLSDTLGARGDLLPHEYTYVDGHDLAAKIEQLLEFGKVRLAEMGAENRNSCLSIAEKGRKRLLGNIGKMAI